MKIENIKKIDEFWRSLAVLRGEGERALIAARSDGADMGAVNWGDLHVCDVGIRIDEQGDITRYMDIEEASPDASGLYLFVGEYLRLHGYEDVQVSTEW